MNEVHLDIQEINLDGNSLGTTSKEISLDSGGDLKEANFGSGIELLMNEKVKNASSKPSSSNSLNDLEIEFDTIGNLVEHTTNKEVKYQQKDSFQNKQKNFYMNLLIFSMI